MQKISIKKRVIKDDNNLQAYYYVPALALKNSDNKVRLLVPHPNGNDIMEFNTLAEAAAAIRKAGFEYALPDGEEVNDEKVETIIKDSKVQKSNLASVLFNKIKSKTNNMNSSIVAASITALAYLNDKDAIDIFIEKLGEDNDKIRSAAIEALTNYQGSVVDKLIDTLTNPNWVSRNSAITCLTKISEFVDVEPEKILVPIINRMDDENPIVQANAILSAGKIYRNCIKRQEK